MASFLSPLLKASTPAGVRLVDSRSGAVVAETLLSAFDSATRKTGLLKHHSLPPRTAMIIAPCSGVHTFFMKFAIDIIFVAQDGTVLKKRTAVPAWRLTMSPRAFATIEMAAGAADAVRVGDRLAIISAPDPPA